MKQRGKTAHVSALVSVYLELSRQKSPCWAWNNRLPYKGKKEVRGRVRARLTYRDSLPVGHGPQSCPIGQVRGILGCLGIRASNRIIIAKASVYIRVWQKFAKVGACIVAAYGGSPWRRRLRTATGLSSAARTWDSWHGLESCPPPWVGICLTKG